MEPDLMSMAVAGESLLAVIDCQERLFRVLHAREALEKHLGILVRGARALGVPLHFTEQNPAGLGPTILSVRAGAEDAPVIAKTSFSCGGAPPFVEAVHQSERGTVVLAGIETHICVLQTALDLLARGYRVHVVADAAGTRNPEHHDQGLHRIARAGAVVTTVESVLFEWMGSCDHPAFKTVSGLIR